MRMRVGVSVVAVTLLLAGCGDGNDQTIGSVAGTAIGAGVGYFAGAGRGRAVAAALGAGAGALIGGAIGRELDEQDREQAQQATLAVLNQPIPAAYYYQTPPDYYDSEPPPPPVHHRYWRHRSAVVLTEAQNEPPEVENGSSAPVVPVNSDTPPQTLPEGQEAQATPPPVVQSSTLSGVPRAPTAQWVSDHSGATGTASVVALNTTPSGSQCRTLQQNVQLASGQTATDQTQYCNSGQGQDDWHKI